MGLSIGFGTGRRSISLSIKIRVSRSIQQGKIKFAAQGNEYRCGEGVGLVGVVVTRLLYNTRSIVLEVVAWGA